MTRRRRAVLCSVVTLLSIIAASALLYAQAGALNGEWPTYGGDLGNTRYAPLDQINRDNFADLEPFSHRSHQGIDLGGETTRGASTAQ